MGVFEKAAIFFLVVIYCVNAVYQLPSSEWNSLYDLYISTTRYGPWLYHQPTTLHGIPWDFTNSSLNNPCSSEQPWQGVVCTSNCTFEPCFVSELQLVNMSLSGHLPPSISLLSHLSSLEISLNPLLRGSIPDTLGHLSDLQSVKMQSNGLTGAIPITMVNLTKLELLALSSNSLNGTIPELLSRWQALTVLQLDSNQLSGSIPESLVNLTHLLDLRMNHNYLHGSIPESIGNLTNLTHIILNGNDLRGTLPTSLGKLKHLTILDVSLNFLHGTIPAELGNLEKLKYLYLSHNALHGPLPPQLGNLTNLLEFQVSVNRLTGSIPETLGNWSNLQFFEVAFNRFKGPIPEFLTSIHSLGYLFLNHNKFEGTLPFFHSPHLLALAVQSNHLEGRPQFACDSLSSLDLSHNEFVGTFPWQNISNTMIYLNISRNNFVGTIPLMQGEAFRGLTYLDISQNELSGTLPACFQHSPNLSVFQAADNAFHGSLDALFQLSVHQHLTFIDISQNQFTGTLPESFFQFVNITSVSTASNCLNNAIPMSICSATSLSTVILDGMGSGNGCSHRSGWSQFGPTLPVCVFDLPKLKTLHLSGLGLTGSLHVISSVSNSLQALSLSHNQLTGSIPPAIAQHQSWIALDLSFNRLSGVLPSLIMAPSPHEDVSLSMQLNHLSGTIPSALLSLPSIDILDGNLFSCGLTQSERHHDLPSNDDNADSYSCGSNEVDLIIYVWLGSFAVCLLGGMGGIRLRYGGMSWSEVVHLGDLWWVPNKQWMAYDALTVFVALATNWLRLLTATMCILLLLCLPVFASLKQQYGTYEDQYLWTLSACLMEGAVPTIILFIIMTGCICFFYYAMRRQHFPRISIPSYRKSVKKWLSSSSSPLSSSPSSSSSSPSFSSSSTATTNATTNGNGIVKTDERTSVAEKEPTKGLSWSQLRWFLAGSVVLSAVVIVVNASYVYLLQQNIKHDNLTAMALLVSFVKVSSNQIGLSFAAKLPSHATLTMWLIAFFSFNNVVVPYLMESFISTSCFRYTTIQSPPMVSSNVKMPMCLTITNPIPYIDNIGEHCFEHRLEVAYQPSFVYSFGCSSILVENFVPVFLLRYIWSGVSLPLLQILNDRLLHRYYRGGGLLDADTKGWIDWCLLSWYPTRWKVVREIEHWHSDEFQASTVLRLRSARETFDHQKFFVPLVSDFMVLITFGLLFPPLAVVVAWSMFVHIADYWTSMTMLAKCTERWTSKDARDWARDFYVALTREYQQVRPLIVRSRLELWMLVAMFWSFTLFDTLGSSNGMMAGMAVAVLMCIVPVLVHCLDYFLRHYDLYDVSIYCRCRQWPLSLWGDGTTRRHQLSSVDGVHAVEIQSVVSPVHESRDTVSQSPRSPRKVLSSVTEESNSGSLPSSSSASEDIESQR